MVSESQTVELHRERDWTHDFLLPYRKILGGICCQFCSLGVVASRLKHWRSLGVGFVECYLVNNKFLGCFEIRTSLDALKCRVGH